MIKPDPPVVKKNITHSLKGNSGSGKKQITSVQYFSYMYEKGIVMT